MTKVVIKEGTKIIDNEKAKEIKEGDNVKKMNMATKAINKRHIMFFKGRLNKIRVK